MPIATASGVSAAAQFLACSEQTIRHRARETVTLSRRRATDAVWAMLDMDSDAESIEYDTCRNAVALIESLPNAYPSPAVAAEPDGHIGLEWYKNPRRILSASVSADGTVYWASLIGTEDLRGSFHFIDEAPSTFRQCIARVMSPC